MRTNELLLRCYGVKDDGLWQIMCLDLSLAAQAETFEEAMKKLGEQIAEYIHDATVGQDKEFAAQLLRRRAPLKYWVSFYWFMFQHALKNNVERLQPVHKSFNCPLPLTVRC